MTVTLVTEFGRVLKPFFTKILIDDKKCYLKLILQLTRIYLAFINQCVAVATSHVTGRKKRDPECVYLQLAILAKVVVD